MREPTVITLLFLPQMTLLFFDGSATDRKAMRH